MPSMVSGPAQLRRQPLPAGYLCLMLEKAEEFGISSQHLLQQCNFSLSLADLQRGQVETIPQRSFTRVFEACVQQIANAAAPNGCKRMSRADFNFMCHAVISSTNLREAIGRIVQFLDICDRRYGWHKLSEYDGCLEIRIFLGPVESGWERFFMINAFQVFSRLYDWLIGEVIPARFEMASPRSTEAERIARIFDLDVTFGATSNRIVLPGHFLDKVVVRNAQELRQLLTNYPFNAVPPSTETALSARVTAIYLDAIGQNSSLPDLGCIAKRLGMASATLRRRLADEGATIRFIKEEVRKDVASKMLAAGHIHLDEIADALGFASLKAFSRAFAAWNGETPVAYQRSFTKKQMA